MAATDKNASGQRALFSLGAPTNLGLGTRGAGLAPRALFHYFGLTERLADLGMAFEPPEIVRPSWRSGSATAPTPKLSVVKEYNAEVAARITDGLDDLGRRFDDCYSLFLGGDHSVSAATYAGVANHYRRRLGVLWIDAHADLHLWQTSVSKNPHGMVLAAILGRTIEGEDQDSEETLFACCPTEYRPAPEDVVILGARAVDPPETVRKNALGVKSFTSVDIVREGLPSIVDRIIDHFTRRDLMGQVHVSFDIDSLDPSCAPGVSTPVPGGLHAEQLLFIAETMYQRGLLRSLDAVEYNVARDHAGMTGALIANMIPHFFGKTDGEYW